MIYLSGVVNDAVRAAMSAEFGLMAQPRSCLDKDLPGNIWAADNGAFAAWKNGQPFDVAGWKRWLDRLDSPHLSMFAVCPDVVADHDGTLRQWSEHADWIASRGFCPAFALQNGCTRLTQVPSDAQVVFVGGDDEYKLSNETARLVDEAKSDGRHVHMGRVNSEKRWLRALAMGCDSVDGTFCRFGPPQHMVDRVLSWIAAGRQRGGQRDVWDLAGIA